MVRIELILLLGFLALPSLAQLPEDWTIRASQSVVRPGASFFVSWSSAYPIKSDDHVLRLTLLRHTVKNHPIFDHPAPIMWHSTLQAHSSSGVLPIVAPTFPGVFHFELVAKDEIIAESEEIAVAACAPVGNTTSNIKHVLLVVLENHSFDSVYGPYCTAAPGSNPTCNTGPACCEANPAKDPSGASPVLMDDEENGDYDPNHSYSCEVAEINGGKMDKFVKGVSCSDPRNFAIPDKTTYSYYWQLASEYAIADRYFQPIAGATSSNKMYISRADYMFTDNDWFPYHAIGTSCTEGSWHDTNVANMGSLMISCNIPFYSAAEGYAAMKAACPDATKLGCCPPHDKACPCSSNSYPCSFDASDVPLQYWPDTRDNPNYMVDLNQTFLPALAAGNLPAYVYIQPIGYKTEHPGCGDTCIAGQDIVKQIFEALIASPSYNDTLLLVTYDEGGGYFDHVSPPPNSPIDGQPYGTRVPMIALGKFAKNNYVSHVVMEHSSIPVFLEWNFFGGVTGQLGVRDTTANNILDLLNDKAFA